MIPALVILFLTVTHISTNHQTTAEIAKACITSQDQGPVCQKLAAKGFGPRPSDDYALGGMKD